MAISLVPYLNLVDKSFKESNTRNYHLSMQIDLHGLVFSVYQPDRNKFIALQAYHFPQVESADQIPGYMGQILLQEPWFAYPFKSVTALIINPYTSLIPQALFDADQKNLYLGFNQPFRENARISHDLLKANEIRLVYYAPNILVEKIKDFWANANVLHFSSALIETLALNLKNKLDSNTLFLNVHKDYFDLVLFGEKTLKFYNQFRYNTKEDFIYFLLLSMEQLGLNPERVDLKLMGQIDRTSPLYDMIYRYVKHFSFMEKNANYGYTYLFDHINMHHYYPLFNAHLLCE